MGECCGDTPIAIFGMPYAHSASVRMRLSASTESTGDLYGVCVCVCVFFTACLLQGCLGDSLSSCMSLCVCVGGGGVDLKSSPKQLLLILLFVCLCLLSRTKNRFI